MPAPKKSVAGYIAKKVVKKVSNKLSGESSKKVQSKLHKIAMKDAPDTAARNKDLDNFGAYTWSKHPAMVSQKGFNKTVNQGKTVTDRQSVRYREREDAAEIKGNARGLKAANKPTKASKTFEGNNEKISPAYRKGMLKNSPPLREGRVRGGGMATLKKQADAAALKKKSK